MKKLLLYVCLLTALAATPALQAATFYASFYADTASANTVKLIKTGKVFSDVTDVYTLTWNATDQIYQVSLDDATFLPNYYRIEDGSGNIVVEQFYLTGSIIEADQIEDKFVRNDADDMKRGNLEVRPASGTTNVELLIDNSSTTLQITATDTGSVSTTGHILQLQAASVDLQTSGGSDIAVTGVGQSATANSAVTRANIDTLKGSGWTWDSGDNTLIGLRGLIDDLTGTGTFTANDSLFLTAGGNRDLVSVQWGFDPTAVNDSIDHIEVYFGATAMPGYNQSGAATMSSATLAGIRANMPGRVYPPRGVFNTTLPPTDDWYVIVVAFDHTSPTPLVWGSNQVLIDGISNPVDATVPIIGDAGSVSGALTVLANNIESLQAGISSSGAGVKVWYASNVVGAAGGAPTEVVWYQAAAASTLRIYFTFYADEIFNTLRFRWQSSHDAASKTGDFYLGSDAGTATTTITHSATPDTWQNNALTQDVSALEEGIYYGSISFADGSSSTSDTLFMRRVLIESFHQ